MVWWWSTHQHHELEQSSPKQTHILPADEMTSHSSGPEKASGVKNNSVATDREDQAQEDLKGLFKLINADATIVAESNAKSKLRERSTEFPDSIYASKMSCSNCFDQAFYCSSAVGQLNNIYRYGGLRSCSDLWAQWRFCMRTKAMSEDMKKDQIRDFNKQKSAKYKLGPSSEDVWETRKEIDDNAFTNVS